MSLMGSLPPVSTPGELTGKPKDKAEYIIDFIRDSLSTYARTALPFVSDAHQVVQEVVKASSSSDASSIDDGLRGLSALDELYESITLNHIARRASVTQGVALLTLYSKGFSKPTLRFSGGSVNDVQGKHDSNTVDIGKAAALVDKLKLVVRREETPGHLPVCWGVLTASLGLSLERSQFLHLFLCARGVLSAAVRINLIGPYAAQQLLLHAVRPIVKAEATNCAALRTGLRFPVSARRTMPQ